MLKGYLKVIILRGLKNKPCSGYDLLKKVEEIIDEKPSSGSLYPLLNDLLRNNYIEILEESNRKKIYKITKDGEVLLEKLTKEKENYIKAQEELLNIVKGIDEKDYESYKDFIQFNENLKNENKILFRNIELLVEFKTIFNKVLSGKNISKSKEEEIKKILKETIKKLKKL